VKLQTASGARGCEAPRRRDNFVDVAGVEHAHLSDMGGACGARPKTSLAAQPELPLLRAATPAKLDIALCYRAFRPFPRNLSLPAGAG